MLSVNTNVGAMVALQYLNQTNAQLNQTQNAVSTGLKVSGPKDDGAIYAIAQNMRAQVSGYQSVTDSLNRGISTVDVALSAGQSISDLLVEMRQKALSAGDASLDSSSRKAMDSDFTALRDQIDTIAQNAAFNGINLVDGSTNKISALASSDGSKVITVTVSSCKLDLAGLAIAGNISTAALATAMVTTLDSAMDTVNKALAHLAAGSKVYSIQLGFSQKLSDTVTAGIGNLVDADMAQESAQLTALQTKQQLGIQALSIANQAPQTVLSLFR
ncbi:MAG TPA: flagellin [Rhizomicrobium sp.]|nr:flagellin [Rhizomicrobium sp.]